MLSNITDYSYFYLNFNSIYEKTQKQYYTNYSNIFNTKNDLKVKQFWKFWPCLDCKTVDTV